MANIKLYGVTLGNSSWARVTQGMTEGLVANEKLAGLFDLNSVNLSYSDAVETGWNAEVAVCVGPPSCASVMQERGQHRERLMMIAANSSWLPELVMERAALYCTAFVAPSTWAKSIIEKYTNLPVILWPHGVSKDVFGTQREWEARDRGPFIKFLHLASTHFERKGTGKLIHAWANTLRNYDEFSSAKLILVVDGPKGYFLEEIFNATKGNTKLADSIELETRVNLDNSEMSKFYLQHDFVIQPSRAEGFGLVPLEARACGVPVVMTDCTGHGDHASAPGVVFIKTGSDEPIDDGPGALAPSVEIKDIESAILYALKNRFCLRESARDHAEFIRTQWSWGNVTRKVLSQNGWDKDKI